MLVESMTEITAEYVSYLVYDREETLRLPIYYNSTTSYS
jgi:hypothetical protein